MTHTKPYCAECGKQVRVVHTHTSEHGSFDYCHKCLVWIQDLEAYGEWAQACPPEEPLPMIDQLTLLVEKLMNDNHPSDEYREAVSWVRDWQHRGDNFGAMLVQLIAKADPTNRGKLRLAFPVVVEAYEDWRQAEDPEQFFKNHIG